jgi:hypothetical protein
VELPGIKDPMHVILREEGLLNGMTHDPETGKWSNNRAAVKRQEGENL